MPAAGVLPRFALQPLFAPLLPVLSRLLHAGQVPTLRQLNAEAARLQLTTASGKPLRFVPPFGSGLSYEERVWWLGEVETRLDNWHDAFNAMIWLSFPRTKAVINQHHHQAMALSQSSSEGAVDARMPAPGGRMVRPPVRHPLAPRGALRDTLTQFDECGVVVVSPRLDLWQLICEHRWQELFWQRREEVMRELAVFVFGHASLDLLRAPYRGLCGKALFLHVSADFLQQPLADQLAQVDVLLAQRLGGLAAQRLRPRDLQPLPLLGIPGVTADNACASYYDDSRQFRPLRVLAGTGAQP